MPPEIYSTASDDEALARQLQEEYEREYRRQQEHMQQQRSLRPSAPPEREAYGVSSRVQQEESDAAYARRLEREEQEAVMRATQSAVSSRHIIQPSASNATTVAVSNRYSTTPTTSARQLPLQNSHRSSTARSAPTSPVRSTRPSSVVVQGTPVPDRDLALRLEQEAIDEEYARRIAAYEEQRASRYQAEQIAATERTQSARGGWTMRRACGFIIPLAVVGTAIAVIVYYFAGGGNVPNFIPDPTAFGQADPFTNVSSQDANRWRNDGQGLTLLVVNALDTVWYPYFELAIQEWDDGTPDALTLSTDQRSPEPLCNATTGVLKVCNGNYGATNWRGINKILIERGYIYASAARMNEYYFSPSDSPGNAQRQYTMCHEIGHGFGLPHSDENFYNKDLGTCMDYTIHPENNDHPNESNFNFLVELYGTVPGSATLAPSQNVTQSAASVNSGGGNGRRLLHEDDDGIMQSFNEMDLVFDTLDHVDELEHYHGWELMHRHEYGASYQKELVDGVQAQVHLLLPE